MKFEYRDPLFPPAPNLLRTFCLTNLHHNHNTFAKMLQPKSIPRGEHSTAPRRSPRFLQPETPDLKAPQPQSRLDRLLRSCSSSLSSTHKLCKEQGEPKTPVEVNRGLRRSARLSSMTPKQEGLPNVSANTNVVNKLGGEILPNVEKRVTRSSSRGRNNHTSAVKGGDSKINDGISGCVSVKNSNKRLMPEERKPMVDSNLLKGFAGKTERRVTRRASGGSKNRSCGKIADDKINKCTMRASNGSSEKGALLYDGKAEKHPKLSKPSLLERGKEGVIDIGKKQIGVKRKRNHNQEEECVVVKGWTKEQELALQSAYFAAKPTPHFWKKVAKMVPGKSAQECFDKVHSDSLTPPQAQPRSRAQRTTPSSFSCSASKLLSVTDPKSKKFKHSRHNGRLAHKTLRRLLQKQYNVDQEEENDLFAFLEATVDPSTELSQQCTRYSTPEHKKGGLSLLKRCQETSSSARRKQQLSRLSTSCGASLISPPVLKQIKNKALHEKYIDQLHCRETKRKAALVRAAKKVQSRSGREESHDAKVDAIKAAKSALFFDARDAIDQFQHLRTKAIDNSENSDGDDVCNSEDEEGEDGP